MPHDNVVLLSNRLPILASTIVINLRKDAENREQWIDIQIEKCIALAEAREQFNADIEFGCWCADNGFGADVLSANTRAAAIAMGREPAALRECLNATERRSLRKIRDKEFPRFVTGGKPPARRAASRSRASPQLERALEAFDDLEAEGVYPGRVAVSRAAGVAQGTAQAAIITRRAAPPRIVASFDPAEMPPTMKERYDATVRAAQKQLRHEITASVRSEIQAEYDIYIHRLNDEAATAQQIIASHKGVLSREMFRKIRACLHPDQCSFAHAAEALQAFSALEKVLVKPDAAALSGPPLPTTAAELMARRRQRVPA